MVKEEITIGELLNKFKVNIKLSDNLLDYEISSDFLKSEYKNDGLIYIFSVDNVKLIINPKDKKETIQKLVMIDGKVGGGVILSDDSIQYLN